jgi:hypothetical protein
MEDEMHKHGSFFSRLACVIDTFATSRMRKVHRDIAVVKPFVEYLERRSA